MAENFEKFLGLISSAVDFEHACYASGINPQALVQALSTGKSLEGTKPRRVADKLSLEKWLSFRKAKGESVAKLVQKVSTSEDWRSAQWLLAQSAPSIYGKFASIEGSKAEKVLEIEAE